MVVYESVPTTESGYASNLLPLGIANDARKILKIDLVTNPGVRRDDLEILECGLAPSQESIALDVALKFQLGVQSKRIGVPNLSTCTEWSITRSAGKSGLMRF